MTQVKQLELKLVLKYVLAKPFHNLVQVNRSESEHPSPKPPGMEQMFSSGKACGEVALQLCLAFSRLHTQVCCGDLS